MVAYQRMRFLLENEDGKDVSKFIGIALGIAGGVLILTGILWFLYHRFGDLWGSLTGIVSCTSYGLRIALYWIQEEYNL